MKEMRVIHVESNKYIKPEKTGTVTRHVEKAPLLNQLSLVGMKPISESLSVEFRSL